MKIEETGFPPQNLYLEPKIILLKYNERNWKFTDNHPKGKQYLKNIISQQNAQFYAKGT